MKYEYQYSLAPIITAIISAIIAIFYIELTNEETNVLVYLIVLGPTLFGAFYITSRVLLDDESITIDYILPLRKRRIIKHEDVEFYGAIKGMKGKGKASMGMLKPSSQNKSLMLFGQGIKDFSSLSDVLEGIYPKPQDTQQVDGD